MSTHFTCFENYGNVNGEKTSESARNLLSIADDDARGEGVGDQFQLPKLRMREIRAGIGDRLSFSGHLKNTDGFSGRKNWRTHDFLNGIAALFIRDGHRFEDGCMRNY